MLDFVGLSSQPSIATVIVLKTLWLIALLTSCIGFFTRTSIAVSFFLGVYLLGLTHSFVKVNHSDAGLLLTMFILMFSHCGDAFSVDALRRAASDNPNRPALSDPSGEYRWPVQMVRITWVIIFLLAGIAKLRRGGSSWMLSDSMAHLILRKQVSWETPSELGYVFLYLPWACNLMAIGAVAIEVLSPLVLFSKLARLIIVPGMLGMQIGIRLIMGDDFTQLMTLYLFFVPWLFWGAWLQIRMGGRPLEVLYDGNCGLCNRTVRVLGQLDLLGRIRFRDVVQNWPEIEADHPGLSQDKALGDMHAYDDKGIEYVGFDAYRRIAWVMPLGWLVLPLLYLPGVPWVGRKVYRYVADNRVAGECAL